MSGNDKRNIRRNINDLNIKHCQIMIKRNLLLKFKIKLEIIREKLFPEKKLYSDLVKELLKRGYSETKQKKNAK